MLASGVAAGIIFGVAFGGDWRRLATFDLKLWPVLVVSLLIRIIPSAPLAFYLLSLLGVAAVAARNWKIPGAALIAAGTLSNLIVAGLNAGMPYDEAERNMHCFVKHVLPELKQWDTPPLVEPALLARPVTAA